LLNVSIVLYETNLEQLKRAITSALASGLVEKLFLIDNSPTEILISVTSLDSRISYLHTGSNLGFGSAHNIALRESINMRANFHLVLNADVYFDSEILGRILKRMEEDSNIGLLMPKVLYPNGDLQYLCKLIPTPIDLIARRFMPFASKLINKKHSYDLRFTNYEFEMNVPYLSGCFMLLRVDAIKNIGLFDERFFMYPEDIDLTRRLHRFYKTIFYPHAIIYHEHGKASYKNLKMLLVHALNIIKYFNKWGWFFDSERRSINRAALLKIQQEAIS
jgi:GT2 family glycosyltransferase